MKKDLTRNIVVKALLNADEFLDFERKCKADDVSQSGAIRKLVNQWLHGSETVRHRDRPKRALNLAMSFPGRRGGAPIPLRL